MKMVLEETLQMLWTVRETKKLVLEQIKPETLLEEKIKT